MLFTFRCWHLLKEKKETKNRDVCFFFSQTGIRNACVENTSARPWGAAQN